MTTEKQIAAADVLARYRAFDPPPEGFDPHTATNDELRRYGLPRRPDPATEPRLARIWNEVLAEPMTFIKSEFAVGPRAAAIPYVPPGSYGGVALFQGQNNPFQWVFGQWVVPKVSPVYVGNPFTEALSLGFWVGIDGAQGCGCGPLQAGVRAVVPPLPEPSPPVWPPPPRVVYSAFTQWFVPNGPTAATVSNFPVHPGDTVAFLMCAPEPNIGHAHMINLSRRVCTSHTIKPPYKGNAVTGCSVEWVLEPAISGVPAGSDSVLLNFNSWECTSCCAGSTSNQFYELQPGGVLQTVTTDSSGASRQPVIDLTQTTIESPTSFITRWLGYGAV